MRARASCRLGRRDRHAGDPCSVLAGRGQRERAPAAADLEHVVVGAELELLADPSQLAPLRVGERLAVVLEYRARVRHRLVEEEREEVVAEVVVRLDVPPCGEQARAAVDSRPRFGEATPPRVPLGAGAGVAQEQLEERDELVGAPLTGLERLAERELRGACDALEETPVVDVHRHLVLTRSVASFRSVRKPQHERSVLDPRKDALEHGHGHATERGRRAGAGARQVAIEGGHCCTEPFPGSKGGLWWNGTRLTQSLAAFQWMSAVTWSGMIG